MMQIILLCLIYEPHTTILMENTVQPYCMALTTIFDGFNVYLQNRIALNLNQITKLFSCWFY